MFLGLPNCPRWRPKIVKKLFSLVFINNKVTCKLVNAVNVCLWFQEWNKNLGANQDPSSNSEGKVLFSARVGCVSPLLYTKKYSLDISKKTANIFYVN